MIRVANKNLIGLFGGSFDPAHKGHLKISKASIKKLNLKKLYWIVTSQNSFKKKTFFSLDKRLKISKKISKDYKKIEVRFIDKLAKSSKTINTLKYLMNKNKKSKFFLIIGSDNLVNFHKWKDWEKLTKLSQLVVFSRKGFEYRARKSVTTRYLGKKNIIFIKDNKIDISSSQIRKNYLL
tara:strand:+ start:587 stop:1126 length:540 start_codon:yes stop_codon:yes gene_type:complete